MLEFVLALPFVFIVLMLIVNFGQALLERQRAAIAVREVAVRHGMATAAEGATARLEPISDAVTRDVLAPRRIAGSFTMDRLSNRGECLDTGAAGADNTSSNTRWGSADDLLFSATLKTILSRLSASHSYEATLRGPGIAGKLLPQPQYTMCVVSDSNPWTVRETGTLGDWIHKALGPLGDLLDYLF